MCEQRTDFEPHEILRAVKKCLRRGNHLPDSLALQVMQWVAECDRKHMEEAERSKALNPYTEFYGYR